MPHEALKVVFKDKSNLVIASKFSSHDNQCRNRIGRTEEVTDEPMYPGKTEQGTFQGTRWFER